MLGILISFAVLFALIKIFEKDRDDLDDYSVATAAIVPGLLGLLASIGLTAAEAEQMISLLVPAAVVVLATFFLLWKNLELSLGRSIAYTVAVFASHQVIGILLSSG